jgi:hypothetical protein
MTTPGHEQRRGWHPRLTGGSGPAKATRMEPVEELAGVLAFNAARHGKDNFAVDRERVNRSWTWCR